MWWDTSRSILPDLPQGHITENGFTVLVDGVGQGLAHREAIACQHDAWLKQLPPGQPAMPPVGHLIAPDLSRYGDGQSTCPQRTHHTHRFTDCVCMCNLAMTYFWVSSSMQQFYLNKTLAKFQCGTFTCDYKASDITHHASTCTCTCITQYRMHAHASHSTTCMHMHHTVPHACT